MSTPEFEIHRAIVHSSDVTTGAAEVRIPSLLGAGQTVNIPTTGLTLIAGEWNVPSAGSSAFVAVSADRTQFLWLTGVTVPTDSDIDFTDNVTIGGDLTVDGDIDATHINSEFDGPVVLSIKNTSGSTIAKGSPVYATGSVGQSGAVEVSPSRADTSGTMPALGLTQVELAHNGEGHAVVLGVIDQVDTSTYTINDSLYVAPTGGLTNTRPTGSGELVQKIGRVVRVNQSTGEILVLGAGRTNDVPNEISITGNITTSGTVTADDLFVSDQSSFNVDVTDATYVRIGNTSSSAREFEMVSLGSMDFVIDSNNNSTGKTFQWVTNGGKGAGTTLMTLTDTGNITLSGTVDGRDVASDGSKLDGIESGATADQTASEILTAIKTVDGSGSGLDADTVDGVHASSFVRSDTSDSATGTHTFDNLRLSSQPLTTYGSGVSATPAYYIGQTAGSNDGWRIYGEGGSNNAGLILEAIDDQTEFIKMRWKKTYSPYSATENTFTPSNAYISSSLQAYSIQGHSNVAGTGNASYHPSGIYSTGTNWLYGTLYLNGNNIGATSQYGGTIYMNNWYRSSGATGWYNETYTGGIRMEDSTWVRTYNSKRYYSDQETAGLTVAGHGGIVIGGQYDKSAFNSTYARKHSIQIEVDTYWGGYHDSHTGALIWCGQMNAGAWGTAELGFRTSNNWGSYYTSNPVRMKGTRAYINLGGESTYNVYADGAGRIGYFSSRRDLKNVIEYIAPQTSLNRILALRPVDFTWKKEYRPALDDTDLIDFDIHRGFIAEEVAEVDRTMATWGWIYRDGDGDDEMIGTPLTEELKRTDQTLDDSVVVSYDDKAIMADLVGSVKYLNERLNELETSLGNS